MGMYTELHFNAELKKNIPLEVLGTLNFMLGQAPQPALLPDHPLFETEYWQFMLQKDSYYFDADTHSTMRYDSTGECYYLCIRCNLKNYHQEVEKFVDWIMPYL